MSNPFDDDDGTQPYSARDYDEASPLGEEGCLFPGKCCMGGIHFTSECHTVADMIALEEEHERQRFEEWIRQCQQFANAQEAAWQAWLARSRMS